MKQIRQPIVTVVGHVDHGKTSILDKLRRSCIQEGEAGGITQKISFTSYPMSDLKAACYLIDKTGIKLNIPGFLLIDTPGHAAFTNLRKRGGSLADLAVLVIDINDGIKPQTAEVIQILKMNKVPFIIALNKIDNISGWRTNIEKSKGLKENIESQATNVKQNFDEKYLTLIGSLQSHGFDADLFYTIDDFSKKIALIPCSAKTGEGIPELIMVLCGLSQKYLGNKLELGKEAKGVVLEMKKERDCNYLEAILYDGELGKKDEIAIANIEGSAIKTKIRVLEEIEPLCNRFKPAENVRAATGIRMQITGKTGEVLPGMPFTTFKGNEEGIQNLFKKELSESIKTDKSGIIAKADSLGSLEALLKLLKESNIPVLKASIGKINKSDIASAKANKEINELDSIIVGFNTGIDEEAKELFKQNKTIKIFTDEVIYKLIEDVESFRIDKKKDLEKQRMIGLTSIAKLKILRQHVFRNTSPAIFGVRVEGGKVISGLTLIDNKGEKVGRVKHLQAENKSVQEASEGTELAISIPGINFERRLKEVELLYSDISENQFRNFKKNKDLLSQNEIKTIQEIAGIKRKKKDDWGS